MDVKLVAGLTLALFGASGTLSAEDLSPPQIYERAVKSTLALEVTTEHGEKFVGAAFLVGKSTFAATAWHLVRDAVQVRGTFSNGEPVDLQVLPGEDRVHDLALLSVPDSTREPLPLCPSEPPIATRLYAIGSPRGYSFSISDGLLSQVRTVDGFPQYQLTCPFSPGNSGGPVVNGSAEVVGLSSWTKTGAQNLNFAIPSRFIAELHRSQFELETAPAKLVESGVGVPYSDSSFEGFRSLLTSLSGQKAHIVLRTGEITQSFDFEVPHGEVFLPERSSNHVADSVLATANHPAGKPSPPPGDSGE